MTQWTPPPPIAYLPPNEAVDSLLSRPPFIKTPMRTHTHTHTHSHTLACHLLSLTLPPGGKGETVLLPKSSDKSVVWQSWGIRGSIQWACIHTKTLAAQMLSIYLYASPKTIHCRCVCCWWVDPFYRSKGVVKLSQPPHIVVTQANHPSVTHWNTPNYGGSL